MNPGDQIRIAFTASKRPEAQSALQRLVHRYGRSSEDEADVIVALGGDGCMLDALRRRLNDAKPVYGMNRGTVGFLMNEYQEDTLIERLDAAERATIFPLKLTARDIHGETVEGHAVNEVSMLRQTAQSARLKILVDDKVRMESLSCDGVLLATPAGSTAYNLSAHGPILPIGSNLLALTPISAFRPRRWRGALLREEAHVRIDVLDPLRRPVSATADNQEVRNVASVEIIQDRLRPVTVLFDPGHALDERILQEQFSF
jgi:NAD+ kinase